MPASNKINQNIRRTTDIKMPIKKDGSVDNRYSTPQFCKADGTKDKRTKNINTHK